MHPSKRIIDITAFITLLLLNLKSEISPKLATSPISAIALTFLPSIKYAIANAAEDNIQNAMALPAEYIIPGTPTSANALATAAVLDNPTAKGPNIPVLPKYAWTVFAFFFDHHPIANDINIIANENIIIKVLVMLSIIQHLFSLFLQLIEFYL